MTYNLWTIANYLKPSISFLLSQKGVYPYGAPPRSRSWSSCRSVRTICTANKVTQTTIKKCMVIYRNCMNGKWLNHVTCLLGVNSLKSNFQDRKLMKKLPHFNIMYVMSNFYQWSLVTFKSQWFLMSSGKKDWPDQHQQI